MKDEIKTKKIEMRNKNAWKSSRIFLAMALFSICGVAFQAQTNAARAAQGSSNGAAGQMPAFYDGELFTVNMFEVPASEALIDNNGSINTIYASNDLDEE